MNDAVNEVAEHEARRARSRHVFLIGFMAAGKTTVGRHLAQLRGSPFIDLDADIAGAAKQSIPEIFAGEGEEGFRRREADALRRVMAGPAAVVATGGGAPCHGDNLARMRERGLVIALTAPLDELLARVADPSTRPLLTRSDHELRALYDARAPYYRRAHAGVRTEGKAPREVAEAVARLVATGEMIPDGGLGHATFVALSERAYPIVVEAGVMKQLGALARAALGDSCARVGLVSDENVAPLHGPPARAALVGAGFNVTELAVPAGEPSKSFAEYMRLTDALAGALDRRSAVIALGGGVVGDLAGFVAATLFRGISCLQVPTTTLAMVDSAIGGKTGINITAGKNLVGAFWQPRLVLSDTDTLATLPPRERRAAFGELIKYGLLDGEELYAAVERLAPAVAGGGGAPAERPQLIEVIARCAAAKSWIVSRDEREETGERALLNLGHTIGHAIEAAAGYGRLLHGEAVGLGLVAACRVSARLGLCGPEIETRVANTLRLAGLDADVDAWLRPDVLERVGVDKKRTGKSLRFVTIRRVGQCGTSPVSLSKLPEILRK